jgi:uncharacterized protein (DUF885 family)
MRIAPATAGRFIVGVLLCAVACSMPPAVAATPQSQRLHALFDDYWETFAREFPEYATFRGDTRYNDRLTDLSPEAIERRKAYATSLLARLRQVDSRAISDVDHVSLDVLATQLAERLRVMSFPGSALMPISQMYGPQVDFAFLVKSTPFHDAHDYDAYVARLRALPTQLQQMEALMRRGLATGWVLPAQAIAGLPSQFDAWLSSDPHRNPAYRPFANFPSTMSGDVQARLAREGRQAMERDVIPAFRALKAFIQTAYLPGARKRLGASTLPGGAAYYDAIIAQETTTSLTAREIHALGLREVARIAVAMNAAIAKTGFTGTREAFLRFIQDSPQFYYTRPEDMLAGYRDIGKRANAQLSNLFAQLPRLAYGVRAMEALEGDNAEHYTEGSAKAGRLGYFEANVNHLKTRPKYNMEDLFLHEAVPGHHLQIARAAELTNLPEFRRYGFFVAYQEGWALYAESLGDEMGFYTDPYSKFGQLSSEMLRACRLVIDTGIHAFEWDRRRAIDYLVDNAGINEAFATAEVDRYIVDPGQALGYKIGETRIKALRAKAAAALGDHFDLRRFHNALIDDGALPLDVLEQRIDKWIMDETRKAARR